MRQTSASVRSDSESGGRVQQNGMMENLISLMVIIVAVGFMLYAGTLTGTGSLSSYELGASLVQANGIKVRSDVRIAGIKVGTVDALALDPKTYRVTVRFNVREGLNIPDDSRVGVSSGLLSSNYLVITPGSSPTPLAHGAMIAPTN